MRTAGRTATSSSHAWSRSRPSASLSRTPCSPFPTLPPLEHALTRALTRSLEQTRALRECMVRHREYYGEMLDAEEEALAQSEEMDGPARSNSILPLAAPKLYC